MHQASGPHVEKSPRAGAWRRRAVRRAGSHIRPTPRPRMQHGSRSRPVIGLRNIGRHPDPFTASLKVGAQVRLRRCVLQQAVAPQVEKVEKKGEEKRGARYTPS